jgi:hypothetical protein
VVVGGVSVEESDRICDLALCRSFFILWLLSGGK